MKHEHKQELRNMIAVVRTNRTYTLMHVFLMIGYPLVSCLHPSFQTHRVMAFGMSVIMLLAGIFVIAIEAAKLTKQQNDNKPN